ncbi:MAG: WD40 repeat domain-containing protein [Deltaproteobacteria bacterium]|nr:WD40 repeat domain-containing protein [Deltaproteobacteria bacterium]
MKPNPHIPIGLCALMVFLSFRAVAGDALSLLNGEGQPSEALVEALLYPGEHSDERFVYTSEGAEAQFCLDSSLSAKKPFAQVYPERIEWPPVGGVPMLVETLDLKLIPNSDSVTDQALDKGFAIRWLLKAKGQDFSNEPVFRLQAVGAEVFSTETAEILFYWQKPAPPKVCASTVAEGYPACDLPGVSMESQAVAISPLGDLAAVATTGLKPGIQVYRISNTPTRIWQAMFPTDSGGAIDVTFSADGTYVAALLGNGAVHRFDAASGGRHLGIPSAGLTAQIVPPGDVVAVGGKSGELILWRLSDGTIEWKIDARAFRGDVDKIAVSTDGRTLATLEYTATQTVVRVWPVKSRGRGLQFDLPDTDYEDMVLSPDGRHLLFTHNVNGLVSLATRKGAEPTALGKDAAQCQSALFWAPQQDGPGCSISGGILMLTADGKKKSLLKIKSTQDQWHVAQSPAGATIAVGAGHLLLWR